MSEMKAGPELDEKLCSLLEPKPTVIPPFDKAFTYHHEQHPLESPLSFWQCHTHDMDNDISVWLPLPVSTDWAAAGKAVGAIKQLGLAVTLNDGYASRSLATVKPQKGWLPLPAHCIGDDLPHALTLAAIEALEKRAEAAP